MEAKVKKKITQEVREEYHVQFNDHVIAQNLEIEDFKFDISDAAGSLMLSNDDHTLYVDILWFDVMQNKNVKWFDIDVYNNGNVYTIRRIQFEKAYDIEIDFANFISVMTDYIKNEFIEDLKRIDQL